jgi:hypothetical protein
MSPRVRRLITFHKALSFSAFHTNDGGSTKPAGRGTGILTNTRNAGSSIDDGLGVKGTNADQTWVFSCRADFTVGVRDHVLTTTTF